METTVLILEVTDNCKDAVRELAENRTTLRGCIVNMSRLEKKDNGKLTLHTDGKSVDPSLIPENIDVGHSLRRIWGMSRTHEVNVPLDRTLILEKLRCPVQPTNGNGKGK